MDHQNSTGNTTVSSAEVDLIVHWTYIILLSIMSVCGILLNILLLVIIHQSERKIRRRNILLVNTIIANLLLVITFPVDIWYSFNIGNRGLLCVVYQSIKLLPVFVVLTGLTFMSIERLYILSKLLTPTPKKAYYYEKTGAAVSWIVCILLVLMNGLLTKEPLCDFNRVVIYFMILLFVFEFVVVLVSYIASVIITKGFRAKHQLDNKRNKRFGTRVDVAPMDARPLQGGGIPTITETVSMTTDISMNFSATHVPDGGNQPTSSSVHQPDARQKANRQCVNLASMQSAHIFKVTDDNKSAPFCQSLTTSGNTSYHTTTRPFLLHRLDSITRTVIKRTGLFVVAFIVCYGPVFLLSGIFAQVKVDYPYTNYIFWYSSFLMYVHVTVHPFIALYVDAYWKRRVVDKIRKLRSMLKR